MPDCCVVIRYMLEYLDAQDEVKAFIKKLVFNVQQVECSPRELLPGKRQRKLANVGTDDSTALTALQMRSRFCPAPHPTSNTESHASLEVRERRISILMAMHGAVTL